MQVPNRSIPIGPKRLEPGANWDSPSTPIIDRKLQANRTRPYSKQSCSKPHLATFRSIIIDHDPRDRRTTPSAANPSTQWRRNSPRYSSGAPYGRHVGRLGPRRRRCAHSPAPRKGEATPSWWYVSGFLPSLFSLGLAYPAGRGTIFGLAAQLAPGANPRCTCKRREADERGKSNIAPEHAR